MGDELYDIDVLSWSERQAELLRRLARGEIVNEAVDWPHVIEEVEDVGQAELRAVRSLLARALEHILKIYGWPQGGMEAWKREIRTFLVDARRSWTLSMRQRLDLDALYQEARELVRAETLDGIPPQPLPATCPFTLGDLIVDRPLVPEVDALLTKLAGAHGPGPCSGTAAP